MLNASRTKDTLSALLLEKQDQKLLLEQTCLVPFV